MKGTSQPPAQHAHKTCARWGKYKSGDHIKFMPGFKADPGSYVLASIDTTFAPKYYKTYVDPCNLGTFQSLNSNHNSERLSNEIIMKPLKGNTKEIVSSTQKENILTTNSTKSDNEYLNEKTQILYGVSVYPNPSFGMFFAENQISDDLQKIEVISSNGTIIPNCISIQNSLIEVNLVSRPSGVYYLKLMTVKSVKIVKLIKK